MQRLVAGSRLDAVRDKYHSIEDILRVDTVLLPKFGIPKQREY